ncbi:MAG: hypothetical protein J6Y37_10620 [Paludibacteraceae bacterium]|nr:hypothetical protein [Paludibacteraceae bacterium]
MNKTSCLGISFCLMLLSCKSLHDIGIANYKSSDGYKNLYVVDTITIFQPISFSSKEGYRVVTDEETFQKLKSYNAEVLKEEGVFLLEYAQELPYDIPEGLLTRSISLDDYQVEERSVEKTTKTIQIRKHRGNITFLLLLINQNYYNQAFLGIDGPQTFDVKNNHLYHKALFPLKRQEK